MFYIVLKDELCHYGVKGMKWGVRKDRKSRSNVAAHKKSSSVVYDRSTKSKKYDILDPSTGEIFHLAKGTHIQNKQVFAGKGKKKKLYPETLDGLVKEYPNSKRDGWQHCKGDGVINYNGESIKVEIHWFQEDSVGQCKHKIKKWKE